eukprot:COSAG03_NODE_20444_length_319_cov_0.704545_2_plen_63_part_01
MTQDAIQLLSVLRECDQARHFGALRNGGYDCLSCAQADDEDWDDIGVPVEDGRRLKAAMWSKI